jgi:hypothetical protein
LFSHYQQVGTNTSAGVPGALSSSGKQDEGECLVQPLLWHICLVQVLMEMSSMSSMTTMGISKTQEMT